MSEDRTCPDCGLVVKTSEFDGRCPGCAGVLRANEREQWQALAKGHRDTIRLLHRRIEDLRVMGTPKLVIDGLREDIDWHASRAQEWEAKLRAGKAGE